MSNFGSLALADLQLDPKWVEHVETCDMPFCVQVKTLLQGYEALRGEGVPVNPAQAEAVCQLLINSGDMTPMAVIQLRKLWE